MAQVHVTFSSSKITEQPLDDITLGFSILNTDLGHRWLKALQFNLENGSVRDFGQFSSFPGETDLLSLSKKIKQSVEIINAYQPSKINFSDIQIDQSTLNELHHYFENMIGSIEQLNAFYLDAPASVKKAIVDLNHLIHEFELVKKGVRRILVQFTNFKRTAFVDTDYDYFSFGLGFGDLYLHYCQLGKQVWDAYRDQDLFISKENIRPLSQYSGEFDLYFSEKKSNEKLLELEKNLKPWLIENGYNPNDKKLALGFATIGKLNPVHFETPNTKEQLIQEIAKRQRITRVAISY